MTKIDGMVGVPPWLNEGERHLVLLLDGAADLPQPALNGLTPFEAAETKSLDAIIRQTQEVRSFDAGLRTLASQVVDTDTLAHPYWGTFHSIPEGCSLGSEVANLTVLGYADMAKKIEGRAALEALSLGVDLDDDEIAFRCDSFYMPESFDSARMGRVIRGLGHRHIYIPSTLCIDRLHRSFEPTNLDPRSETMRMILQEELNQYLRVQGVDTPCTLWGASSGLPYFEPFVRRYGMQAAMVAAVPVIRGIGMQVGMYVPQIFGATGDIDSDFGAKVRVASELLSDYSFVFLHLEAADEASHRCDPLQKRDILSRIDREVIDPLYSFCREQHNLSMTILPDHYTDSGTGMHLDLPVPFLHIPPSYL